MFGMSRTFQGLERSYPEGIEQASCLGMSIDASRLRLANSRCQTESFTFFGH